MKLLFVAILALVSCLPPTEAPEDTWTPGVLILYPDPDIYDVTRSAAKEWRAATGLDVRVGDGGVPVRVVGMKQCGLTSVLGWDLFDPAKRTVHSVISIEIAPARESCGSSLKRVVLHEIAHALIPDIVARDQHADTGMFAAVINGRDPVKVDDAARDAVCAVRDCHEIADSVGTGPL